MIYYLNPKVVKTDATAFSICTSFPLFKTENIPVSFAQISLLKTVPVDIPVLRFNSYIPHICLNIEMQF